ncbi:hypothetical protein ONS95_015032 [Cadophora gregata]|uniref:uncharacterized protein n=1 Tax=Cadophora gregata TaxID=51156 RepID=UPI0026DABAE8|nr:uncharacterized protein ONS95_015032 [Cadophora gregata]KAK0104541.1 hypothetical protein ONS95_015032 [Cadophora gregata]
MSFCSGVTSWTRCSPIFQSCVTHSLNRAATSFPTNTSGLQKFDHSIPSYNRFSISLISALHLEESTYIRASIPQHPVKSCTLIPALDASRKTQAATNVDGQRYFQYCSTTQDAIQSTSTNVTKLPTSNPISMLCSDDEFHKCMLH